MGRRLWWAGLVAALIVAGSLAGPASADVTGGCQGRATIDGVTYTPANDTPANPVIIPKDEGVEIPWEGSSPFDNNRHHGELRVQIGPFDLKIASWADPDPTQPNLQSNSGIYELDEFYEDVSPFGRDIVGIYRISGFHTADGGSCTGFAVVEFEGGPLDSPIGQGAAGAAGLGLLGLIVAAFPKGTP